MSPMRILVISDTHGDLQALRMAFAAVQPDAVLHLGDCAGDLFYVIRDVLHDRPDFPFRAVCGNCDPPGAAPQELTVSLGGQTIFNPGSAKRRLAADSRSATYAVLTLDASGASAKLTALPPL